MVAISRVSFSAQWTPANQALRSPERSLSQKIYDFIKNVIFFIPYVLLEAITRWCILPSSSPFMRKIIQVADTSFKQKLQDRHYHQLRTFKVSELSVTTPDGIELKGHLFKHPNHDQPNARVLLFLHGNGDVYQSRGSYWLINLLQKQDTPYSFLFFNPRGIGNSKQGTPNEKNLLIDADSMYQFAKDDLKIGENFIDIYGQSLGGAVAAQLKKLHPETGGRLFLDRTFSTLSEEVFYMLQQFPGFIVSLALKTLKKFNWEFNSYKALTEIRDRVSIFYHPQDPIIPPLCNLATAINTKNPHPTTITTHRFQGPLHNYHMDPLAHSASSPEGAAILECFKVTTSAETETAASYA